MSGKADREFKYKDKKYFIHAPSSEDIRGADWQYSKTYTKCLVEGITTTAEMHDILTRRGIIGPEFNQRAEELMENLSTTLKELEETSDLDEKRHKAVEAAIARDELYMWNQRLNGPLSNTCESIADESRVSYLASCLVRDENGKKVWEDFDAFNSEEDREFTIKARLEIMLYSQGLESGYIDNTPEQVALREVELEMMSKAEEALESAKIVAEEEAEEVLDKLDEESKNGKSKPNKPKAKSKPKSSKNKDK